MAYSRRSARYPRTLKHAQAYNRAWWLLWGDPDKTSAEVGSHEKTPPRANLGISGGNEKVTRVPRRTSAKKDVPPEWREQAAVVEWCSYQAILKFCVINIRNEGRRTYAQANVAKMMGMRKGASDLFIARPFNGKAGLFIEMKENREYTPSEMKTETWMAQEAFIEKMISVGYAAFFAFGAQDGINKIKAYLSEKSNG